MKTISKLLFLLLSVAVAACSNNQPTPSASPIPRKIEHKYFSVGDTVEGISFDFTINSVKVDTSIPTREGNKWIVMDVSLKDTVGKENEYSTYASMYGDFAMLDDEKYIYKSYNKEQRTEFEGTTRDYVLFQVPVSKNEFILFEDEYGFDNAADLDDESRNIVRIHL